jgi:hypothetical protein
MKTTIRDGFCFIEACGLLLKFPATDDSMSDDRVEIRCGGSRVFVEYHDDGPCVGKVEYITNEEHWSSPNGCHEDCPACAAESEGWND